MPPTGVPDVDPAALVPTPPAPADTDAKSAAGESGYVLLSDTNIGCASITPPQDLAPLEGTYLVLLEAGHGEDVEDIAAHAPISYHYPTLGLLEVAADAPTAQQLTAMSGVAAALPALGNLDQMRKFAAAFDAIARAAQVQQEQSGPLVFAGRPAASGVGYPTLVAEEGKWVLHADEATDWAAPAAIVPVVNFSVGPTSASYPMVPNDIVNLATYGASRHCLLVAAAGNCGQAGEGTMSAWASTEWVLGVGASEDADGTVLADYSSRGRSDKPGSGPDLVAWGTIETASGAKRGTSYAAPRVSAFARLVTAALCEAFRYLRVAQGEPPHGLSLVGVALIDKFGPDVWQPTTPLLEMDALPVTGLDTEALGRAGEVLTAAGVRVSLRGDPALVRELLVSSATPIEGYGPHEVGAGYVDEARVIARLGQVTALDLLTWSSHAPREVAAPAITEEQSATLAALRVFDPGSLAGLAQLLRGTGPILALDFEDARFGLSPLPAGVVESMPLDERVFGWPVPDRSTARG